MSLLGGKQLTGGKAIDTVDALGNVNGQQILATPEQIQALKQHITSYQSPYHDLRQPVRALEQELLTKYTGFLIGNQCLDFGKQDGITEIEESTMANAVERRLNDLLLRDETEGKVTVSRKPIYVSCVSNFTNFLDLFRKTLRSMEVGVPCIILGRSNTSQHSYRWAQLLAQLMNEHGIDPGMLTFLSCSLDDIKDITASCQESTGNLYTTCSRQLAASIKSGYPNTVASTGGPNTLVVATPDTLSNPKVQKAIQTSASIECAGQCTALRHCVVPSSATDDELKSIWRTTKSIDTATSALKQSMFDGVFPKHVGSLEPTDPLQRHETVDAYFQIRDDLPLPGMNEYWRKVAVDFTRLDMIDPASSATHQDRLAAWLNENQPISLAINGPRHKALKLGLSLFDKTGMVVNTIGSSDDASMPPALTCQARPQEAEIFGEFPPRSSLSQYTKFPVVVPSSNPSYDAFYAPDYLLSQQAPEWYSKGTQKLLDAIQSDFVKGYGILLIEYLRDATRVNPKLGFGTSRTATWGLQRPPLGRQTYLRCPTGSTWDDLSAIYLLFYVTNARPQVEVSIDPANDGLISFCMEHRLPYEAESIEEMKQRQEKRKNVFNTVNITAGGGRDGNTCELARMNKFPMVGNFVSLYLPLGHIKSTKPNDSEFMLLARMSKKWLTTLF